MTKIDFARKVPGAKIAASTATGDYVLNHRFASRDCPKLYETLNKIRAAGEINLAYWHSARKGEV